MSTISNVDEAIDALCRGEFFQVGGKLIDPEAIIQIERDSEAPRFHLVDGRSVQHDRFKSGDVGDYLAEAFQVATRGSASAAIKPLVNLFLRQSKNDEVQMSTLGGSVVQTYGSFTGLGEAVAVPGEIVVLRNGSEIHVRNYNDGANIESINPNGGFIGQFTVADAENTNVYAFSIDPGAEAYLHKCDATGITEVKKDTGGSFGIGKGQGLAAIPKEDAVYVLDQAGESIYKLEISGSSAASSFPNVTPSSGGDPIGGIAADQNSSVIYYVNDAFGISRIDASNLSANPSVVVSESELPPVTDGKLVGYRNERGLFEIEDSSGGRGLLVDKNGEVAEETALIEDQFADWVLDLERV